MIQKLMVPQVLDFMAAKSSITCVTNNWIVTANWQNIPQCANLELTETI